MRNRSRLQVRLTDTEKTRHLIGREAISRRPRSMSVDQRDHLQDSPCCYWPTSNTKDPTVEQNEHLQLIHLPVKIRDTPSLSPPSWTEQTVGPKERSRRWTGPRSATCNMHCVVVAYKAYCQCPSVEKVGVEGGLVQVGQQLPAKKEGILSPWRQRTAPVGLLRYSSLLAR